MKTKIILSAILTCMCCMLQAQPAAERFRIEVTFLKTTHLIFPDAVKYVDLGSTNIIAGKVSGVENVVRVKAAARDFPEETNFSVICADGRLYSFDVVYSEHPSRLSIVVEELLQQGSAGDDAEPAAGTYVQLPELDGVTPVVANRIMYNIYKRNEHNIKHIGCKQFGMQALLRGIYVYGDLLFLHTSLQNFSNLSFEVDYIKFTVKGRKVAKRMAMQETEVVPVRTYNNPPVVKARSTVRTVFVLPKLTIVGDEVLEVEIYERGGGRHQRYRIENTDLLGARPVDNLKLR